MNIASRNAGTCLGENRASQITKPVSQLKYTEVQKEVTLRVNMHLFFQRRSFSIINFHLVNKTPPVTNQRRELCVSRPWCCSLSLALPAVLVRGLLRCSVNINNLIILDKAKFTFRINCKADITLKSCKW